MGDIKQMIAEANQKGGRARQRAFAGKAIVKSTQASRAENLCQRGEELIKAVYECIETGQTSGVCAAIDAMELAIKLDRKGREQGR